MSITYFIDARIEDADTLDRLVRFVLDRRLSLMTGADLDDQESGKLHDLRSERDAFSIIDTVLKNGEPIVLHEFSDTTDYGTRFSIGKATEFLQNEGFGYRVMSYDDLQNQLQRRWIPGMPYEVAGQMSIDDKLLVEMDTIDEMIDRGRDAFDAFKDYHRQTRSQTFSLVLGEEAMVHIRAKLDSRTQDPRP